MTAGAESGTTWISDNAPDALLYGTLVEAATFLKTPEEIPLYQQRFDMALQNLKDWVKDTEPGTNTDMILLGIKHV